MSGKAFGWARDLRGLSGGQTAKAVLLLMADYADRDNALYPSVATMAEELESSERTVQRALNTLIADGLVEREFRTTSTGKMTSSRYVLKLDVRMPGGVSECHPSAPSDGQGRGDTVTGTPRQSDTIHMNLCSEPDNSDELSEARARASEAFDQIKAIWPTDALDFTNVPEARTAFAAIVHEGVEPADLVHAAQSAVKAGNWRKAPSLNKWLIERRWEGRLPGRELVEAEGSAGDAAPQCAVPAEVMDALAAAQGSAWAGSYASRAGWNETTKTLIPRTSIAHDQLRRHWPREAMARLGVTLGDVERAVETAGVG